VVGASAPSTARASVLQGDAAFHTRGKKRPARSASSTLEAAEIHGSILRSVAASTQTKEPGLVRVPAGTVVRVMQTHALTRRSKFVDEYITLDPER